MHLEQPTPSENLKLADNEALQNLVNHIHDSLKTGDNEKQNDQIGNELDLPSLNIENTYHNTEPTEKPRTGQQPGVNSEDSTNERDICDRNTKDLIYECDGYPDDYPGGKPGLRPGQPGTIEKPEGGPAILWKNDDAKYEKKPMKSFPVKEWHN